MDTQDPFEPEETPENLAGTAGTAGTDGAAGTGLGEDTHISDTSQTRNQTPHTPPGLNLSDTLNDSDLSNPNTQTYIGQLQEEDSELEEYTQQLRARDSNVPSDNVTQDDGQLNDTIPFVANPQDRDPSNDPRLDIPPGPITDDMIEIIPFDNRGVRPIFTNFG